MQLCAVPGIIASGMVCVGKTLWSFGKLISLARKYIDILAVSETDILITTGVTNFNDL